MNTAFFIAAQAGVTPLATGAPGMAKTASIQAFARSVGRKCYTLIGSLRDPADVGGYPYPVTKVSGDGKQDVYMSLIPPQWAFEAHDGAGWVIFIDELTCCPPAVQAALLRVIAEHVVGDLALPPNTWIVSASNPPGVAANGFELEPPMSNRLCHLRWQMDWSSWDQGMMSGGKFPEPQFPVLADNWEDRLAGMGGLVAAFRKRKPSAFHPAEDAKGNMTMERSAMSGPWPSPRSWTNAMRCMAAAESVQADETVVYTLLAGCVGDAAAGEFGEWRRSLDLPDPEELIANAAKALREKREFSAYQHPNRADKVVAMLTGVVGAVLSNNTKDRWEAGMEVFRQAANHEVDVACVCCSAMVKNIAVGARPSAEFLNKVHPVLRKIGAVTGAPVK